MRTVLALALIAACHAAPESSEIPASDARDPRIRIAANAHRPAEASDAPDASEEPDVDEGAEPGDDEGDDPGTEVAEVLARLRDDAAAIDDRESDAIVDVEDRCPDAPEDNEGFEDIDGCPDVAPDSSQ